MQQQTIETLRQALQESALPFAQQEPLASHTTFQIGGPAVFWCTPKTVDQLRRTLALCRENGVRTYLLGNGSNTLFADEGYDGAVIDLRGLNFGPTAEPQPDGSTHLTAGAGLTLGRLCAVAIVGRPVSRYLDDGFTLEVNRLCSDGTKNACSILYAAAARAARAMGYRKIITYTLDTESGASLRAAGWTNAGLAGGKAWTGSRRPAQPLYPAQMKYRYEKRLNERSC